jgi:hypothetical protein
VFHLRILHVTEAFNGGVVEVLREVISSSMIHDNMLLFASHEYDPLPDLEDNVFKAIKTVAWGRGHLTRFLQLKNLINSFKPDIVHLHSSWAGLYGRIFLTKSCKIIYSPHGFGFQRKDLGIFLRGALFLVEGVLQLRTDANVSFWPLEVSLISKLGGKRKNYFCPELISSYFDHSSVRFDELTQHGVGAPLKVIGIGRLTSAKDPIFFCNVVRLLKTKIEAEYMWVGDGDAHFRRLLGEENIVVSGWLPVEEVQNHIRKADVTLLTSSWDAGPATLYHSVSLGTPIAARDFASASILGIETGKTPELVAEICVNAIQKNSFNSFLHSQEIHICKTLGSLDPMRIVKCYFVVLNGIH